MEDVSKAVLGTPKTMKCTLVILMNFPGMSLRIYGVVIPIKVLPRQTMFSLIKETSTILLLVDIQPKMQL